VGAALLGNVLLLRIAIVISQMAVELQPPAGFPECQDWNLDMVLRAD
jgi:hypothetical protein